MAAQDNSEKDETCVQGTKNADSRRRWSTTELPQIGGQLDEERCKEVISLMNHTSDTEIIQQKMKETFEYRQHLIHNPDESHTVLTVFPRLLDTKGLVSIGFLFCNHNS